MGLAVPKPYSRRWLWPLVLGPVPERWRALTIASLLATPALAWGYFGAMGLAGGARWFAVALLCALPGLWRCSWRFPVLLDAPSVAVALGGAWAARGGPWWASVPLAFLGGATRETVPLFAALWAWSPLPLVGLATVGWWRKSAPSTEAHLAQPLRAALTLRREIGFDAALYLRPLGAALAGLALPTAQMVATVLVAAAQLLVAVDTIRLLAWAAPVLVLGAVKTIPPTWWALAILVTLVQRDERV